MDDKNSFLELVEKFKFSTIDTDKLEADLLELNTISEALPKDNILSMENCLKLERYALRGMNICDYWIPIMHIVGSEQESEKETAKNKAYIDPPCVDGQRLTAELRKAYSETNADYVRLKSSSEKVKSMKTFFERKRDTFKTAIMMFKDQLYSYKTSDKGSSGEDLYKEMNRKQYGESEW